MKWPEAGQAALLNYGRWSRAMMILVLKSLLPPNWRERVKSWIGNRRLPSGNLVGAGDILILLRKRGRFFELLLSALQIANVQVAGADRMQLAEQIEIQDLLALGDVMHLADDDLQLAAVLKSPLFGMSEDQLYDLAYDRGKASLMSRLMAHRGADGAFGQDGRPIGTLAKPR